MIESEDRVRERITYSVSGGNKRVPERLGSYHGPVGCSLVNSKEMCPHKTVKYKISYTFKSSESSELK